MFEYGKIIPKRRKQLVKWWVNGRVSLEYLQQYWVLCRDADVAGATEIIDSIEKQWACADQELFIASIILNPFYLSSEKYLVFANLLFLNKAGTHALLSCTYQWLFQQEMSDKFTDNVNDYLGGKGLFSNLDIYVARSINVADHKVSA